ncbi:MAG: ATP-grasp domain-containing protein [Candidatus Hodarchaeota archaeon]
MKKVLITGAGGPAGVNFLRSLNLIDREIGLYGTDINTYHLQFAKPWTKKMFLVPRATSDQYIPTINGIIKEYHIDMVHPQPDIEVSIISENREKIEALTFLPKKETIRICQDKYLSANIWKEKKFPSVNALKIRYDHLESDIEKAFDNLGEKLWIRAKKGAGGTGSTPIENEETGVSWIKYWKSRGKDWEFIAQEYLPGRNIAFQSIFKNGEIICSQARERIEYIYPYLAPSGVTGTPIVAKTIHDETINKMATEAILAIDSNASGIFCVDMKEDKNGKICPTEINAGRFFTTSYFFSFAAKKYEVPLANMPFILIKLAFKEKIPEGPSYNILPKNLYWIRHIDCSEHLIEEKDLK